MAYVDVDWIQIADRRISIEDAVMKEDLINASYPVGSVMIRIDNANPANLPLFEGTSWRKISEGRMLIGANSTYPLGTPGGNATHQHSTPALTHSGNAGNTALSAAQSGMPAHRHTENAHTHPAVNTNNKYVVTPHDLVLNPTKRAYTAAHASGVHYVVATSATNGIGEDSGTGSATATINDAPAKNAAATHTHTINHTHAASNTGSGSNMPPYLAVNMWVRES